MEKLSEVLQNMPNTASGKTISTSNTRQHGLMEDAGRTNCLVQRPQPLTENELTLIASRLLAKPLTVTSTKKKIYGPKTFSDEHGSYVIENQPIGEEDGFEVSLSFFQNPDRKIVESALRHSPPHAATKHLMRLAVHKRLGSSDEDRAILLHDYAEALRGYSDFVVFMACKCFWENDASGFYPKIITLQSICEEIHQAILAAHRQLIDGKPSKPAPNRYDKSQYFLDPKDNPLRRTLCDFLIAKGDEDHFEDTVMWSNYYLEMIAKSKYGWKADSP